MIVGLKMVRESCHIFVSALLMSLKISSGVLSFHSVFPDSPCGTVVAVTPA